MENKDNKFNFDALKKTSFWVSILGATKVITGAFGLELFLDGQIETIADGIAAIATVIGVAINH